MDHHWGWHCSTCYIVALWRDCVPAGRVNSPRSDLRAGRQRQLHHRRGCRVFAVAAERGRINPRPAEERASNGGSLNNQAISLPPPEYPAIARAAHASGEVTVEITVGENGEVISAHAVSGHPLLQAAAVAAARQAKFSPTQLNGEAVKVKGALVYNFVAQ